MGWEQYLGEMEGGIAGKENESNLKIVNKEVRIILEKTEVKEGQN